MKKLLCLLFAALLLSSGVSALELPGGLDEAVPRELIESAEAGQCSVFCCYNVIEKDKRFT